MIAAARTCRSLARSEATLMQSSMSPRDARLSGFERGGRAVMPGESRSRITPQPHGVLAGGVGAVMEGLHQPGVAGGAGEARQRVVRMALGGEELLELEEEELAEVLHRHGVAPGGSRDAGGGSEDEIRRRAYQIHLRRGRDGNPVLDWLEAEAELRAERRSVRRPRHATFPGCPFPIPASS
ncbi:MAG: DUF2934 domain-containing protein [Phycisphaerae bacterium]|nr:DUF2934 domain-containing protein [Phycisphaerae bacterium]